METKEEGKDLSESLRLMTIDVSMVKNLNADQMFVLFGIKQNQPLSSIDWDHVESRYEALKQRYNPSKYSGVERDDAVAASALIEKVYKAITKSKPVERPAAPISKEQLKAMDVSLAIIPQLNNAQLRVLFGADVTKDLSVIKSRYKKLILKFHPDKYQGEEKELAKEASQALNVFYDTLDKTRQRSGND
jgi:preprotein translocase subunit Sec63